MKVYPIKLIFLGTGAGTITKKRKESGIFIKSPDANMLIDPGSSIIERLLAAGIAYDDIDYILITHFHPDHLQGLTSFLFCSNYKFALRKTQLNIIAPYGFKNFYKKLLDAFGHTIKPESYDIKIFEVKNQHLSLGGFRLTSKKTTHTQESVSFRIEIGKLAITYSGDTDYCKEIVTLSKRSDILILECSFPDEIKVKNHLTPSLAGRIARESNSKTLILTHFFPICDKYDIIKQAKKDFKGKVVKAYDLLKINIAK